MSLWCYYLWQKKAKKDRKTCFYTKKMIFNSKRRAEHPFLVEILNKHCWAPNCPCYMVMYIKAQMSSNFVSNKEAVHKLFNTSRGQRGEYFRNDQITIVSKIVLCYYRRGRGQICTILALNDLWTCPVLTTHRLAYLCCQCNASLDMKLALSLVVARSEQWRYPLSSPLTWK